jgi:hypothetical protein
MPTHPNQRREHSPVDQRVAALVTAFQEIALYRVPPNGGPWSLPRVGRHGIRDCFRDDDHKIF